jgi:spore germination cell wall hydrolase CwlJ-like protein
MLMAIACPHPGDGDDMTATGRPAPQAASFINRNPEGAALAAVVAGLSLLGAMMPPTANRPLPGHATISAAVTDPALSSLPATSEALVNALPVPDAIAPAIAPDRAFAINAAMPLSTLPNPKATPFVLGSGDAGSQARALDCLTAAIFYEAAGESDQGQAAVAQVVLNRVRDPAYPKSVCAVVFDGTADHAGTGGGCQFTFTCDGAMARAPSPAGWQRARRAAAAALGGAVEPTVGWATHYHTQWVAPAWAPTLLKTAVIGAHIFYRPPSRWSPGRYAGAEPEIAQMAALSSVPMTGLAATAVPNATVADTQPQPRSGAAGGNLLALVLPGVGN